MKPDVRKIRCDTNALFLDVDGTLLEIRERPEDVHADKELLTLLEQLLILFDGAMALVSGRSIDEIDRIFGSNRFPAVGAHGAELRRSPAIEDAMASEPLPEQVLERLKRFVDQNDGLQLEQKQGGAALHYRRAPELLPECRTLMRDLMPPLDSKFRLIEGKMVFEIAPRHHNKGDAIRKLLRFPEFCGRQPVFIGDDVTDEDGFVVVNELHGTSIRVGRDKPTAARYALDDVLEVRNWLQSMADTNRAHHASRRTNDDKS